MFPSLHCELAPMTQQPCPLSSQLSYLCPVNCQPHRRTLGCPGISSSTSRACSGRAQSARFARAQPSRRVLPLALARPQGHALSSPACQNPPSHPWHPTAPPSELLAARRRLQRASATVGAAKATPARHLPLGTAQAYPPLVG